VWQMHERTNGRTDGRTRNERSACCALPKKYYLSEWANL